MTSFRILAVMSPEADGEAGKHLPQNYDVRFTQTLRPTLSEIKAFNPDVILIDIDANTQGKVHRITQAAKAHYRKPFIILIKSGRGLPKSLKYYDKVLSRPFVAGKLQATIDNLMATRPEFVIQVSPFTLDRRTNVLSGPHGTVQLGPKLGKMLALFMECPRQPISSMALIKKVWGSSKTQNIRTLHVHIHWLRKILEDDIAAPKYLKTADKNMGYIFDLSSDVHTGGEPLYLEA